MFLFLLAAVVGLSAKTIDTKDLTVTAPDTWIAESSDVGYPISSLVTMSNASETEMLVIGVYEVDVDLQSFLQQQVVEGSNNFFNNASYVGEIRDEKLGDAPAKAVEFQTDVLGVPHRGTAYAAQASVGTCFTFYAYKTGTTPTSKSVLSTLRFKDNVAVENKSLADRLSDFSKLIASNPLKIGDNLLQTKFDVNNTAKSICTNTNSPTPWPTTPPPNICSRIWRKTYSVRSPTISILRILYRRQPEPATLSNTVVWTKTADRSTT